jgi:chorismate-pyruvate lyase
MIPLILAALAALHGWPDTAQGRAEAMAALQGLNVELLTHDSATATLEAWCASHHLAEVPRVVARRVKVEKPADAAVRQALGAGPDEPVRYRRVDLACGDKVLSQADNWYLPARLTPEMNAVLDTTDTPFGRAVAALDFRRRTLSARLIDPPLPQGWDMKPPAWRRGGPLRLAPDLLEHRAVLTTPDGRPFSLVVETYRREVLAFR